MLPYLLSIMKGVDGILLLYNFVTEEKVHAGRKTIYLEG
jgi:hypothetical protein